MDFNDAFSMSVYTLRTVTSQLDFEKSRPKRKMPPKSSWLSSKRENIIRGRIHPLQGVREVQVMPLYTSLRSVRRWIKRLLLLLLLGSLYKKSIGT